MSEPSNIVSIAAYRARAQTVPPLPSESDYNIQLVDMGCELRDIGITRTPLRSVMVAGMAFSYDNRVKLQPLYTPAQARLVAERLLAAARAAECAGCAGKVEEQAVLDPPAACVVCEAGAVE